MKGVMCEVPQLLLDWRKRTGAEMWDEMWEGVLHMPPVPNRDHQDLKGDLFIWLRTHWARPRGHRVHEERNLASIGGWPHDYRIPDLILLTRAGLSIDHNEYLEGPPLVVVEVRSPGDETVEKLPFYAKLGVPEAWIIDRDSRVPQILELHEGEYQSQSPAADGWIRSAAAGISLRAEPGNRLGIQLTDDPGSGAILPED